MAEEQVLDACREDGSVDHVCRNTAGDQNILHCLIDHRNEVEPTCEELIRELENSPWSRVCTQHLLVPMEIASMLLLATASIVLLCTLLRCCCRYVCIAPMQIGDDMSIHPDEDLSDEDESVGSVTPLPSGVKMVEPNAVEQPMEDELPAYTEVVAGAAIARTSTPPPSQIQL